ncbi:hypothetical protein Q5752_002756 [Cryptotrichosporon argae]
MYSRHPVLARHTFTVPTLLPRPAQDAIARAVHDVFRQPALLGARRRSGRWTRMAGTAPDAGGGGGGGYGGYTAVELVVDMGTGEARAFAERLAGIAGSVVRWTSDEGEEAVGPKRTVRWVDEQWWRHSV